MLEEHDLGAHLLVRHDGGVQHAALVDLQDGRGEGAAELAGVAPAGDVAVLRADGAPRGVGVAGEPRAESAGGLVDLVREPAQLPHHALPAQDVRDGAGGAVRVRPVDQGQDDALGRTAVHAVLLGDAPQPRLPVRDVVLQRVEAGDVVEELEEERRVAVLRVHLRAGPEPGRALDFREALRVAAARPAAVVHRGVAQPGELHDLRDGLGCPRRLARGTGHHWRGTSVVSVAVVQALGPAWGPHVLRLLCGELGVRLRRAEGAAPGGEGGAVAAVQAHEAQVPDLTCDALGRAAAEVDCEDAAWVRSRYVEQPPGRPLGELASSGSG